MSEPTLTNHVTPNQRVDPMLFAGTGEVGALMRTIDWSATPLGPVSSWPQSLRTAISICLHSRFELFIWWGPELVMIYNDAYRQTLQAKHPWALGRPGRVVWAEIWPVIGPMLEHVMATGQATWSDDLLLFLERHGYPEETYHTFSYSPILDESGKVGGVFTAVTQTTEKVIAERRLRTLRDVAARSADAKSESEAWNIVAEVLADNPYDVQFAALYRLNEEGTVAQPAALAGVQEGHPFFPSRISIDKQDEQVCAKWIVEAVRSGKPAEMADAHELGFNLPGGAWNEQPNEVVFLPLVQTGQVQPLGVLIAGVSRRKRLDESYRSFFNILAGQISKSIADAQAFEKERERAEALAEIDRAKTAFFSNVSHEFRTPLTLMLGPLEDTIAEGEDQLGKDNADRLETVHRNGMRLLKLVNMLLDFSRIEAGRVQASYEAIDLATFTAELASVFRSAVERAGMYLRVECEPIRDPVYVDRDMWEKIVLNLLSNAFKFTFEGGIRLTLKQRGGHVELSIADTGTGIPQHELPRLFERFHRVEGAQGRSFEGSGIGLALVQELVKLHGGMVGVDSTVGKGTTFTVSIPTGKTHLSADRINVSRTASTSLRAEAYVDEAERWVAAEPATSTQPDSELKSLPTVVLADDNADMRDYVQKLLSSKYRVLVASDGEEALKLAKANRPDLILTDVMMPVLDGFGLLTQIRSAADIASTPVIMLSARAGEEARVEGMQAGADDYLVKPFTARELLARVNAHVSISRTRRDAAEKERQLLAEAEAERRKLRDLFEQAPAAIGMMTGPEHVWTYLNPQYVRLLGRSHPGELLNRRICDTLPEIGPQGFIDLLDRVYRTGERYVGVEVLAKLVTPSGDTRDGYFDFVYQPIRGADGAVEGIMVHSVEVTDKVLARKEVEQKQELLLAALNASATGTFRWDPATDRFEHFDDNLKQLFGIPQDEAVTTTAQWLARIHPNDRRGVEASLEHCRDGADFEMEYRVPLPGGRVRWIYDRAKAFQKDGTLQFVGACTDITSARELTEQLRALNDIGQRIAAELDPDKLLQLITDVATQHTGAQFGAFFYNVEDSERGSYMLYTLSGVDRSHFDKFPMPRNTDVFAPTFEGAPPVRSANIRKDPRYGNNAPHHGIPPGHLPVVSYLAASVKGKEGHVIGGLFFGHSSEGVFTERDEKFVEALASQAGVALENARLYRAAQDELERRRKIELELEQQREFLVLAQKSANVGSWQLDLTKNPITATWSEELQVLYGYKPGTFEGSYGHWVAALHPDDRESAPQSVMDAIAKHEPWMREFRIIRRDGAIRWMSGSGQCYYDEAGNPKRMIGVNMDITERKIAEDALRNSEKLAATGRLAATIAHEINNPLEAITNLIFLARRNRDVPDSVQRHLELADRELDRVSHIAQQTLGFYRDTTAPVIINVQEAVRDVLRLFERKLEYKNLSLKSDVPANMDIQALRGEIRQVLSNLIANAIEASSKGGRVLIRARHIKSHGRDAVRISVSDCGHGIPANLRSSVFMPFFTTKKDVGTGLGLWVTKSMVEKHGGTIRFRSTEGHGTVFSIVLPARMSGQNHQSHTAA